jgi:hypothetical protein
VKVDVDPACILFTTGQLHRAQGEVPEQSVQIDSQPNTDTFVVSTLVGETLMSRGKLVSKLPLRSTEILKFAAVVTWKFIM